MAEQIAYFYLDAGSPVLITNQNAVIKLESDFPQATLGVNSTLILRPIHQSGDIPYTLAELQIYDSWEFTVTQDYNQTTDPLFSYDVGTPITVRETVDGSTTYGEIVIKMAPTTQELIDFLANNVKAYEYNANDDDFGNKVTVGMKISAYLAASPLYADITADLPFVVRNNRLFNGPTTPLPPNFLTPEQIEAGYVPRFGSTVDVGALLNSDDYFGVYNKDTQVFQKYPVSDLPGTGDMTKAVYDPNTIEADCFDSDNIRFSSVESVSQIINLKSNKDNVLELDNVDVFTPTANYHPATKKYVDDNGGGGGVSNALLNKVNGIQDGLIVTANVGSDTYSVTAGTGYNEDNRDTTALGTPVIFELATPVINKQISNMAGILTRLWLLSDGTIYEDLEESATVGDLMPVPSGNFLSSTDDFHKQQVAIKLPNLLHGNETTISTPADYAGVSSLDHATESKYVSEQRGAIIRGGLIKAGTGTALTREAFVYILEGAGVNDASKRGGNTAVTPVVAETNTPIMAYNYIDSTSSYGYRYTGLVSGIDSTKWDDGSNTLATVPTNLIQTQFCWLFNNGSVAITYGRKLYATIAEAESNVLADFHELENNYDSRLFGGVVTTAIIVQQGFTDFATQSDKIEIVPKTSAGFATIQSASNTGYFDVNSSVLSFNDGTRTLTETPVSSFFRYQEPSGQVYEIDSAQNIQIADTEGLHFIYRDGGVLKTIANPNRQTQYEMMVSNVSVSYIDFGDSSFQQANIVTDIKKVSSGMSTLTTAKNFYDNPIYLLSGGDITDFPSSPNGDLDTDSQFGIGLGSMLFADRKFNFTAFSRGDTWRVMYKDGANVRHVDKVGFAYLTEGDFGATTYDMPMFNNDGTPTEVDNDANNTQRWVWYFISVVNSIDQETKLVAWMGNSQYTSENDADAGYSADLEVVESSTTILQEMSATHAVLYKTRRTYDSTHACYAVKHKRVKPEDVVGGGGSGSTPSELIDGSTTALHKHEVSAQASTTSAVNDTAQTLYYAEGDGTVSKLVITGNNKTVGTDGSGNLVVKDDPSGGSGVEVMIVQDQKSTGTDGGSSIAGVQTRTLNTIVTNNITGASLSTNQVTLPAGTYVINGKSTSGNSTHNRIKLVNISGESFSDILGISMYLDAGLINNIAHVECVLTLTASSTFELKHYIGNARATNGLGFATSDGNTEIFSQLTIQKIG